ncbi:MAG: phosphopantothenoylcysteine decarboxylase [Candidatus Omnitrophica bacterium]|nr:phosphopantothenoylcysteine decarboxylase [Candidatus Omnitrophota bacterium]
MESHEIILGVTGSIGAYKAADLVRRLKERGCGVTCVMTHEACQFITPLTLEALSERPVYTELFRRKDPPVIHTTLADHARLVLIAPATANVLGKLSHGLADDLLGCLVLATTAPVLIAPAMNVHMYRHPAVQQNIARLKTLGYHFVGPDVGRLACGYEAVGHLADVEAIVRVALGLLASFSHPAAGGARRHAVHQNPPHKTARRHRSSNGT